MERLCNRCGSLVSGEVKFCPVCGEVMQGVVDLGKGDDVMPSGVQSYGNQPAEQGSTGYSAPQYGRNIAPVTQNDTMTTGRWFGTILLCTCLGIVSMILNIIWGFGSSTPEPKRSFCRAMLIFNIVGYALVVFGSVLVFSLLGEEFSIVIDKIPWFHF